MTTTTLPPTALDLDALTATVPAPRHPTGALSSHAVPVDGSSAWSQTRRVPGGCWAIAFPHPDGGTVLLSLGQTALALSLTPARYGQLRGLLVRDPADLTDMVIASILAHGSDTIRVAEMHSREIVCDAQTGEGGWTRAHDADLAAIWGGGINTRMRICTDAAHRLHSALSALSGRSSPCTR